MQTSGLASENLIAQGRRTSPPRWGCRRRDPRTPPRQASRAYGKHYVVSTLPCVSGLPPVYVTVEESFVVRMDEGYCDED